MSGSSFRFTNSQDTSEIPVWFLADERKHRKKPIPVTREMVEEYKEKWKEINARPIKKLAEAKARKKRRVRASEREKRREQACRDRMDGWMEGGRRESDLMMCVKSKLFV